MGRRRGDPLLLEATHPRSAPLKNRTVLISGASIAGPTLAYWLYRHGFRVTLVERASSLRLGGQALDLRGTAREVAARMGLLEKIRAAHTGAVGVAFVDAQAKELATLGPEVFGDSGGPIAEIEILRGDLVRLLHDATRDEAEYLFDESITSATEHPEGVDVTFERSAPRTFDLVVGADGVHSNVREKVFGPREQFLRELGAIVAIFTAPLPEPLGGWAQVYSIPGAAGARGRSVGLYPVKGRAEAKAMFYFPARPGEAMPREAAAQKQRVAEAFADEPGFGVPALLEALPNAPDFYFDRMSQVHLTGWARGRVVLLGDAAHCGSILAGSGSSMATVGAYVLAQALAADGGDHAAAYERYEATMRGYVTACQALAKEGEAAMLPGPAWKLRFRNAVIRLLPYLPGRGLIARKVQRLHSMVALEVPSLA